MTTLYHYPLCPFSRKIRLLLGEQKIGIDLIVERYWENRKEFITLNPSGEVPILLSDEITFCGHQAIAEFIENKYENILPEDIKTKAENRRLIDWFDNKFYREVTYPLIHNRIIKRYIGDQQPSSEVIRKALQNIKVHLPYIEWLAENRKWLSGDHFSVADLSAAAQLSVIDYMNDLDWSDFGEARAWYAKIKSRPSFRSLLSDVVDGIHPPNHYKNLDF